MMLGPEQGLEILVSILHGSFWPLAVLALVAVKS